MSDGTFPNPLSPDRPQSMSGQYSNAVVFEILKQYLREDNPIPVVEAVRQILELMKDRDEPAIWKLFARLVLDIARQISYKNLLQVHFARLVSGMYYGLIAHGLRTQTGNLCKAFDDVIRAEYASFPPHALSPGGGGLECDNVNVYAFAARLTEAQILKVHTGILTTALETAVGRNPPPAGRTHKEQSARVSAAAMFIIYAGETIYARMLELHLENLDVRYRYWKSGPSLRLADTSSWHAWEAGFSRAARLTELDRESRVLASRAAAFMGILHSAREWT